ncbi:MAG: cation:proton antiporter [Chloroflexi bacterium]|nr:cation:proton antiporter [Chloroflexota bacterium]
MPDLTTAFAIIATVLIISALASGVIERAPISFPMIFLGAGVLLGEHGLGVIRIGSHDTVLEAIAVVSLAFVLFLDAVKLRFDELSRDWLVPLLTLGPGTILVIGIVAGAAYLILRASPIEALMLGAILASTDPVVIRDVVRDQRIPGSVRRALSVESGLNDVIVLPILLVLIAVSHAKLGGASEWLTFVLQLLVVGPAAGFAVGGLGAQLMNWMDARIPIRREYQALYGVGLVLAAYAAGQGVGGDGFLAAFAAGIAVTVLNANLCDCFLEYGEVTAEMAMLLAFILFGALLSTLLGSLPLLAVFAFALVVIGVARPLAILLVLIRARLSWRARTFVAWFGPRGLSSLLFGLLLLRDGAPSGERLLAISGLVVVLSVVLHGASATPLAAWYARRVAGESLEEERESTAGGLFREDAAEAPRVSVEELARRLAGLEPPIVLDVRTRSEYLRERVRIPGSVRVLPDHVDEWATTQEKGRSVVAYCS